MNCRICENALEPLLTYKNMPKENLILFGMI